MRELQLRDREKRVAERELELICRELEILRGTNSNDLPRTNQTGEIKTYRSKVNIKSIAELLPPFNGENIDFDRWVRLLNFIKVTHELDDKSARVLIGSRLKCKAFEWLYSKAELIEMSVENLLSEMKNMFKHPVSKLLVRRKEFELRVWKYGESFTEYLHDKSILANKVPIDEEEVVEYIIERIPDQIMKNQARIQKLKTKASLLETCEKIMLRQKMNYNTTPVYRKKDNNSLAKNDKISNEENKTTKGIVRCYN